MLNLPEIVTQSDTDKCHLTISTNVKRLRQEKGMSQLEVALSIGQRASGFYANAENYSHGKHFNIEHLCKLAKLFDVDIKEFFTKPNQ